MEQENMDIKENMENIMFVTVYYHKELLYDLFTDDEKSNDYAKIRKVKNLCNKFSMENWDNENEDLEETTEKFLKFLIKNKNEIY